MKALPSLTICMQILEDSKNFVNDLYNIYINSDNKQK